VNRLRIVIVLGVVLVLALPASATDTVGVQDPVTGQWTLRDENTNTKTVVYGNPGDVAFTGDWDCDGVDTPGLYRRSDGFAYLRNSNTTGIADVTFLFGNPGDLPLAGDFDGDGCDTLSIYRPSEARFYIINELGSAGSGLGAAEFSFEYGNPGDVPVIGDWDGNRVDTPGLRRPSDGFVYVRNSNSTGLADISYFYGDPGDLPVAGDWDGDGLDTFGLFRPSTGAFHLKNTNSTGIADSSFFLGSASSTPITGSFDLNLPPPPGGIALQQVASGLSRPVLVAAPPGDPRLFVVEQTGDIEILSGGVVQATPFLRIGVTCCGEQGLLGLAFHPQYASNGKFYVNYTIGDVSRVSEFTVSSNPNVANPSERILLTVPQPAANHNGGMLMFDESGYLLIAFGDGGGAGDPGNRAENANELLGKLLRIDVNTTSSGQYGIPPTNPFAGGGGAPEVYLLGLRNPWRFDVDGGLLYIGDVGQGAREEVTILPASAAGANLGWNTWEGTNCFQGPCGTGGFVFPQVEYTHAAGCSVTGGHVYRGTSIPGLAGTYFYGDFCAGRIHSLVFDGGIVTKHADRAGELGVVSQLSSFGYDAAGEVYVTSLTGQVFKIVGR
jgi:hypothetical protein